MNGYAQNKFIVENRCPLSRNTPFVVANVSMTQLSIARHYGGITFQGRQYIYFGETDEIVRGDVLRWIKAQERKETKAMKSNPQPALL